MTKGLRDGETKGLRDGETKGLRDEVKKSGRSSGRLQERFRFRGTQDIIDAAEDGLLPNQIMMTFHPQRWTDNPVLWAKELVWQNFKNQVKKYVVSSKK